LKVAFGALLCTLCAEQLCHRVLVVEHRRSRARKWLLLLVCAVQCIVAMTAVLESFMAYTSAFVAILFSAHVAHEREPAYQRRHCARWFEFNVYDFCRKWRNMCVRAFIQKY
jgi:hypothetical protein